MAACIECEAEFDIGVAEAGDLVSCPECGLEMEIVSRRPLELDAVTEDEEEDTAEEEEDGSGWSD